jgi:polyferredoxin
MNSRKHLLGIIIGFLLIFCSAFLIFSVERFPPPDFDPNIYQMPQPTKPPARAFYWEIVDIFVLFGALSLASYFVYAKRSRRHIFWLTVFSIAYFGFFRKGCVCPIGSIQNVALGLFNNGYVVPISVIIFFLLPLIFTVVFGRVFCSSVCPLGAIQDVFVWKPVKIRPWLERGLRIIPFIYLGAAVLFAATGSAFIICEYDPFISFYRLGGSLNMLLFGAGFLILGMFIGRPYCRFLCPYGAILSLISRVSKWNVWLTEEDCIKCQICDVACPYGAIATPNEIEEGVKRKTSIGFLAVLCGMTIILVLLGSLGGKYLAIPFSKMHKTVKLAELVAADEAGKLKKQVDEVKAFKQSGRAPEELYYEALNIRYKFIKGGTLFGAFIGLVIGLKLIGMRYPTQRSIYEPDRAACVACGRCYAYCPKEIVRVKKLEKQKTANLTSKT